MYVLENHGPANMHYPNRREPVVVRNIENHRAAVLNVNSIQRSRRRPTSCVKKHWPVRNPKVRPFPVKDTKVDAISEFAIPGVNKLFDSNYSTFSKCLWAFIVFGITAVCLYQLECRIQNYLDEPIVIDVTAEYKRTFDFPAVTLCPYLALIDNVDIVNLTEKYKAAYTTTAEVHWYDLLRLPDVTAEKIWDLAGFHQSKHISENYTFCNRETGYNCHLNLSTKEVATYKGTCLTFGLDGPIIYDGVENGFTIFLEGYRNKRKYSTTLLRIDENGFDPRHELYADMGSDVQPSFYTDYSMTMKEFKRANTKNRPCMPKKEAWDCKFNCINDLILKNVSCKLPYLVSATLKMCSTPEEAKFTFDMTLDVYKRLNQICKHCQRPCHSLYFFYTLDVVIYKKYMKARFYLLHNLVDVVKEETPYDLIMLIGDFGGTVGFFMGICLLNVIQMLETIVLRVLRLVRKLFR